MYEVWTEEFGEYRYDVPGENGAGGPTGNYLSAGHALERAKELVARKACPVHVWQVVAWEGGKVFKYRKVARFLPKRKATTG